MPCAPCCSFPNGNIPIAPCLLSTVAYILTSTSLWSCNYAETQIDGSSGVGVGLVYREYDWRANGGGQCTPYSSYSMQYVFDSNFKAAQGFALAAWMVGFVMSIAAWSVAPCISSTRLGWRIIGGLFFLIGLFQLLTLLLLASSVCSNGCKLSNGGVVSVVAFLLWWITAAICCMVPEANMDMDRSVPPQVPPPVQMEMPPAMAIMETTTQRVEADGMTVVEKVVTNRDGTTTVTTTIIPPAAAVPVDANFEKR